MSPLDLIPAPYRLLAAGIGLALAAAAIGGAVLHYGAGQYKDGQAEVQGRWTAAELKRAEAARKAEEANRAEEQRRVAAQKEIEDAHQAQLAQAAADAASATAAADGLRNRIGALVAASRRGPAAGNPTPTGVSAPAPDATGVCADVLVRLLTRGQLLASVADQRGAAGAACVQSYEALTPASK